MSGYFLAIWKTFNLGGTTMDTLDTKAVQTARTAATFPLLVEQIVSEILEAKTQPEVNYLMGRILGAKHMVDFAALEPEQVERSRAALKPLLEHTHFWNWAFSKPYGYPGDYMVLEYCYENQEASQSTALGKLLDRWLLESQLASGVRERKDMLMAFIERMANVHHQANGTALNVLSLASGSAREIREQSPEVLEKLSVMLVDQDLRSLSYAQQHLPASVTTWQTNALRLRPSDFPCRYDLVYSFGFFDYLRDDVILHCLKLCREVLAPNGSILFPLKMNSKYRHWLYDVLLDWRFVKRELDDGFQLAARAGLDVVEVLETANESVVFYHCVPKQM